MNASWPMVIGALLAGTVGGFMIPVRPEIRDVPAISASKATEPAKKTAADKNPTPATTENAEVRQIPVTDSTAKKSEPAVQAEATPCERQAWPNQSPNCLDRSAKVAPAETVPARRIDPAVSVQDKPEPTAETKTVAAPPPAVAAPKPATTAAPQPEPVKPKPKIASTPAQPETQPAREAREQSTERPARTEQASTPPADEPRAQTKVEKNGQTAERPRRASRRTNRDTADFNDDIPTRIYLRGPDGRLYLAPEYRPSGREVYIMR